MAKDKVSRQDRLGQEQSLFDFSLDSVLELMRKKKLIDGTTPDPLVIAQIIETARWLWNASSKQPKIPIDFEGEL